MQLTSKQLEQIETIQRAFKASDGKHMNDKEALFFALEFTADLMHIQQTQKPSLH